MKNRTRQRTKQDLLLEVSKIRFTTRPSTILNDAVADYEKLQSEQLIDEHAAEQGRTWSQLGHQIVGHEVF